MCASIERHGVKCASVELDLTRGESAAFAFDEAESRIGDVSILVNNASGWRQDTFSASSTDELSYDHGTGPRSRRSTPTSQSMQGRVPCS